MSKNGKHTQKYLEQQRLRDIHVTDQMEAQFEVSGRPRIMERARRVARSRLGKAALALGLAAGVAAGATAIGHDGAPAKAPVPASAKANTSNSNHTERSLAAAKRNAALLSAERQQLQDGAVQSAQEVAHDLVRDPTTISYDHGKDVGAFRGIGNSNPESYMQWHNGTKTITVASINMPFGNQDRYNSEQFDFRVSPTVANQLNAEAQRGPLTAQEFEQALTDPAGLTLLSAQVQTPQSSYPRTITIDNRGGMSFDSGAPEGGPRAVTPANYNRTVVPFTAEMGYTSNALQQGFVHANGPQDQVQ